MNQEAQEYYNIASWTKDKVNYNRISKFKERYLLLSVYTFTVRNILL